MICLFFTASRPSSVLFPLPGTLFLLSSLLLPSPLFTQLLIVLKSLLTCHLLQEALLNHLATGCSITTKNKIGPGPWPSHGGMSGHGFRERGSLASGATCVLCWDLTVGTQPGGQHLSSVQRVSFWKENMTFGQGRTP